MLLPRAAFLFAWRIRVDFIFVWGAMCAQSARVCGRGCVRAPCVCASTETGGCSLLAALFRLFLSVSTPQQGRRAQTGQYLYPFRYYIHIGIPFRSPPHTVETRLNNQLCKFLISLLVTLFFLGYRRAFCMSQLGDIVMEWKQLRAGA